MRVFLVLILLVPIALAAGWWYLREYTDVLAHPGYFIVGYGDWVLESTLILAIGALLIAFLLLYVLIRIVSNIMRLPHILKRRGGEKRFLRSQEALINGLLDSAEGNWESAEQNLIKHAADSGVPLINYLTAARAAQSRGALDLRDEYLQLAKDSMPEAEFAVGLTKAELQLSQRQFNEAIESLLELDEIAPSHAAVLKLMHRAYEQLEDWEGLSKLIPALHTNKVMMEAEIKLLETSTYSALLKQRAADANPQGLRDLWTSIPEHVKKMPGMSALFFAAMIEVGSGAEIQDELRDSLNDDWNPTSLVLFGCIDSADPARQLEAAEQWLTNHPKDPVLLRVLGKLALRIPHFKKAESYLRRSLIAGSSVEAYQLLGDLAVARDDKESACEFYRKGLLLASSEVVAQIRRNPMNEDLAEEPAQASSESVAAT